MSSCLGMGWLVEIIALFSLQASRVIWIEPSVLGTITVQETHGEGSFMGCSSITPSFSILSMSSETLALRLYGTDLGGTEAGFTELSV